MKFLVPYPFTGFQKISLSKKRELHLLGSLMYEVLKTHKSFR